MLEPPLAARAATHASPDEISEMEEILQRQQVKLARGETTVAEDAEFHYGIALASGNSVVLKVLDILMDLLRDTRERSMQVEGRPEKSLAGHRRILSAISARMPNPQKQRCGGTLKMWKKSYSTGFDARRISAVIIRDSPGM